MITTANYERRFGLRKLANVMKPKISGINEVDYPFRAVVHYPVYDNVTLGITPLHIAMAEHKGTAHVDFVDELAVLAGKPRRIRSQADREKIKYYRTWRTYRELKDLEKSLSIRNNLVVFNYGTLTRNYDYTSSTYRGLHIQKNLANTVFHKIRDIQTRTTTEAAEQFLIMELPAKLPTLRQLKMYESDSIRLEDLPEYADPNRLYIYEIWKWLGDHSKDSMLRQLDHDRLSNIHMFITNGKQWTTADLGVFWGSRKSSKEEVEAGLTEVKGGRPSLEVQKRFYRLLLSMYADKTNDVLVEEDESEIEPNAKDDDVDVPDTNEINGDIDIDEDDEDILVSDADELQDDTPVDIAGQDVPNDPSEAANYHIDNMVKSGRMTEAEATRARKLADTYKTLPDPFGSGKTLLEAMTITPEQTKVKPKRYKDSDRVYDKRSLESGLDDYHNRYIEEVLKPNILQSIVAVQKSGDVLIRDVQIEDHEDIMNQYYLISVQVEVIGGATSTVKMRIPKPNKEGALYVNGSKYRLRPQRVDKPIRKVGEDKVSLTSVGYGKISITRSEKIVSNYQVWLQRELRKINMDSSDDRIKHYKAANVMYAETPLPRAYTAVSKSFSHLTLKDGTELVFDYRLVKDHKPSKKGMLPMSLDGSVEMDSEGMLYRRGEEIGTLPMILGLGQPPREQVDIKFFDKELPIGFVLAYMKGLTPLLDSHKIPYRTSPVGTRLQPMDHEMVLKFQDVNLIVDLSKRKDELMLSGFNQFHKQIKRYNLSDFNSDAAYQVTLEGAGIGSKYLKEIRHFEKMFIDPITLDNLINIKEPTTVTGLLDRSVELLVTEDHAAETAMQQQRIRGYEKYAGEIHKELSKSIRSLNAKNRTRNSKLEMDPFAVWKRLMDDPALILSQEQNPLHNLKEKEMVTFNGEGGRSTRSMVGNTRAFQKDDCGVISEAGKDDGGVGVNTYMSTDANLTDVYGNTKEASKDDFTNATKFYSAIGLLSPFTDCDDQQRSAL